MNKQEHTGKDPRGTIRCEDLVELLLPYLTRELGEKQSRLVHDHLRTCEACRKEAARMEATAALLRREFAGDGKSPALQLSAKRRARVRFVALHPVWDWVYIRHRWVSALCAVFLVVLVIWLLRAFALFQEPDLGERIPIWRMFRSGRLPELVEEARREYDSAQEQEQHLEAGPQHE